MFLDPGDLELGLVEEAAARELDLPRGTSGGELQLLFEKVACSFDPRRDDAELTLDAVGVEQQPEPAGLVRDADREPRRPRPRRR